jgi:hypothetical protein
MFSRAVLDTSRTRDDADILCGRAQQVNLNDPGLAPVVGVIAPQLNTTQGRKTRELTNEIYGTGRFERRGREELSQGNRRERQ